MEVSQMNKTAILSFIIDEVALKCRNVSSNMRKRIHWMLKHMEIAVKEYDARALVLNGWVRFVKEELIIPEVEEMRKGVSDYYMHTQEKLDRLVTLNNEIRCHRFQFILSAPVEVESIEDLVIDQDNYEIYSKSSFNTVKHLQLKKLSTDQIKFILTRFKRIDNLKISDCSLEKLDLSQSRIKQFCFDCISFKESVYLPREIEELDLTGCKSPNLIKAQKVNRIDLDNNMDSDMDNSIDNDVNSDMDNSKEYVELIKTLKGVKVAKIGYSIKQYFTSLPSSIRKIEGSLEIEYNSEEVMNQFPYLIEVMDEFPIQPTDKSELRGIWPKLEETEEKFNLRPRKIRVDYYNAFELNSHPELFEKVEWVYIDTKHFNYDILPCKIKRIQIWKKVDLESMNLNRLEKERE